jgi:signal peptidase
VSTSSPLEKNSYLKYDLIRDWTREAFLAIGLVFLILSSLWIATGQFPPMVVVESGSMMHNQEDGSLGAIDPGDLVLVMNPNRVKIITYVEATQVGNDNFGYMSHGMEGDVIIYSKNGGNDTPVIHRALLKAIENNTLDGEKTWDVPGTTLVNVRTINWTLNYPCEDIEYHDGIYSSNLSIEDWKPSHTGYLTTGDNLNSNGCKIDQSSATGNDWRSGLKDEQGNPVTAVKDNWIMGIASSEIPWIGAIKLLTSSTHNFVTEATWMNLFMSILVILCLPAIFEYIFKKTNILTLDEEE